MESEVSFPWGRASLTLPGQSLASQLPCRRQKTLVLRNVEFFRFHDPPWMKRHRHGARPATTDPAGLATLRKDGSPSWRRPTHIQEHAGLGAATSDERGGGESQEGSEEEARDRHRPVRACRSHKACSISSARRIRGRERQRQREQRQKLPEVPRICPPPSLRKTHCPSPFTPFRHIAITINTTPTSTSTSTVPSCQLLSAVYHPLAISANWHLHHLRRRRGLSHRLAV